MLDGRLPDCWCPACEVAWKAEALPGCWMCGAPGERYRGRNSLEAQADARVRQALISGVRRNIS